MDSTLNINQIVSEIEKLDYNDKINIMARIVDLLKQGKKTHHVSSLTKLKGLGKNVWLKTNTDSYISTERESWD